jgi:hypothetical protein
MVLMADDLVGLARSMALDVKAELNHLQSLSLLHRLVDCSAGPAERVRPDPRPAWRAEEWMQLKIS